MSQGQSGGVSTVAHGYQYRTAAASLVIGVAFFALWFWLLPQWLGFRVDTTGTARWRWLAALPSVLGFAVAQRWVWDFGWTGRGTPAPFAPPQRLVVVGLYRHVRDPMYLGVAGVSLAIHLFVLFLLRSPKTVKNTENFQKIFAMSPSTLKLQ
jgi:protein-S-isoprenylcysteine O-methyltransferase Ste14